MTIDNRAFGAGGERLDGCHARAIRSRSALSPRPKLAATPRTNDQSRTSRLVAESAQDTSLGVNFTLAPEPMTVFIAHAHQDHLVAREIATKLRTANFEVFLDVDSLPAGVEYDQRIAAEIEGASIFVFLASQHSIRPGCYALTELELAKQVFANPSGHVLPVLLDDTRVNALDPYLVAGVTVMSPRGNVAAEVTARVQKMLTERGRRRLRPVALGGAGLVAAGSVVAILLSGWTGPPPEAEPTTPQPQQTTPTMPPPPGNGPAPVVVPRTDPLTDTPEPIKCPTLHVAKSPARNLRRWPVHGRPELSELACHIADRESVNLLCRQGLNAICIEGSDSETSSTCRGFIHSDAFVSGRIMAPEAQRLPACKASCPPLMACKTN
jgi:hypothetical protein